MSVAREAFLTDQVELLRKYGLDNAEAIGQFMVASLFNLVGVMQSITEVNKTRMAEAEAKPYD